jgi:hypothetical protein
MGNGAAGDRRAGAWCTTGGLSHRAPPPGRRGKAHGPHQATVATTAVSGVGEERDANARRDKGEACHGGQLQRCARRAAHGRGGRLPMGRGRAACWLCAATERAAACCWRAAAPCPCGSEHVQGPRRVHGLEEREALRAGPAERGGVGGVRPPAPGTVGTPHCSLPHCRSTTGPKATSSPACTS